MTTPANESVPAYPWEQATNLLEAAGFEQFVAMRNDQLRFYRPHTSMRAVINARIPTKVFFFDSHTPQARNRRLLWDIFDDESMFGRIIKMWQEEEAKAPVAAVVEDGVIDAELVDEPTDVVSDSELICDDCEEGPCVCPESAEDTAQYADPRDFICGCCEEECNCPDRPAPDAGINPACTGDCEGDMNGCCTCELEGLTDSDSLESAEYEYLPEHALKALADTLLYTGMSIGEALEDLGMYARLYNTAVIRERLEEYGIVECCTCGWWYMIDEINHEDECESCEADTREEEAKSGDEIAGDEIAGDYDRTWVNM